MIHHRPFLRRNLRGIDYEVTARIIDQSALDGSALDAPLEIVFTDGDDRAAAARRAIAAAEARDGADTGGNGSGGIWPLSGGLPGHLPQLPDAARWLIIAALAAVALALVMKGRR